MSTNQSGYISFTLEEKIIHHLMLNAATLKRNGLFYGKLGVSIAFFEYGRYWKNQIYTDFALELKNSLIQKIDGKIMRDFASGLCGFGWGIEYMIQRQFKDCDNNNICLDIDEKVMLTDIRRINDFSLETGLEGFLHYILIRLEGARKRKESRPFDAIYLKDTCKKIQSLPVTMSSSLQNLKQVLISYMNNDILVYKPDISSFTKQIELNTEDDMIATKLGLSNGLAGKLIQIINLLYKQQSILT